jgi:predicted HicB family RNase H-like nuclease
MEKTKSKPSEAQPEPAFLKLRVSRPLHRRLKVAAARSGATMEAVAVAILEDRVPRDQEANPHE